MPDDRKWLSLDTGKMDDFMVARAILQYLVNIKKSEENGSTVHGICRNAKYLFKGQRDSRVLGILRKLETRHSVKSLKYQDGAIYWSVTETGLQFYMKTVTEFYEKLGFRSEIGSSKDSF